MVTAAVPTTIMVETSPVPTTTTLTYSPRPPPPVIELLGITVEPIAIPGDPDDKTATAVISEVLSPFHVYAGSHSPTISETDQGISNRNYLGHEKTDGGQPVNGS